MIGGSRPSTESWAHGETHATKREPSPRARTPFAWLPQLVFAAARLCSPDPAAPSPYPRNQNGQDPIEKSLASFFAFPARHIILGSGARSTVFPLPTPPQCHHRQRRRQPQSRSHNDQPDDNGMALSPDVIFDIASACVCAALILARVVYRVLFRCKLHPTCHRTWRIDDFYMTIAILPLIGRASCISLSFVLNPTHTYEPATEAEAAAQGISVDRLNDHRMLSHKLLIPARICYALFLWCLKLGLLAFYTRFINVFPWGKVVAQALWAFIVFTFVAVVITTLAECRPLSLMWALNFEDTDETCHRALGNLILMAVCNIISDVALIILPFPILQHLRLDLKAKLQLGFLFSVGGVVVAITILRLPLILNEDVSQQSRSMWASVEILCACVVANTPFFYALLKDLQRRHDDRTAGTASAAQRGDFYLQSIPSSSGPRNPSSSSKASMRMWEQV